MCAPAAAQPAAHAEGDYRIARWTTTDGLPQNTISDILLLPNGELWLATFGGLARFDGYRFHVLDIATDDGLPANRVVSLAPAGSDAFWFLTQQGHLGRVDRGRALPGVPPPSPSVDALGLFADGAGDIYCKLVDGSIWHTDGARPWTRVLESAYPGGVLHAFASAGDGDVWASLGLELVKLRHARSVTSFRLSDPNPDLFSSAGGVLWLARGQD